MHYDKIEMARNYRAISIGYLSKLFKGIQFLLYFLHFIHLAL